MFILTAKIYYSDTAKIYSSLGKGKRQIMKETMKLSLKGPHRAHSPSNSEMQ